MPACTEEDVVEDGQDVIGSMRLSMNIRTPEP